MAGFTVLETVSGSLTHRIQDEALASGVNRLQDGHTLHVRDNIDVTAEMSEFSATIAKLDKAMADGRSTAAQRSAMLAYKGEIERKLWTIQREQFASHVASLKTALVGFKTGWTFTVRSSKSKGAPTFELSIVATEEKDHASVALAAIASLIDAPQSGATIQTRKADAPQPSVSK